MLSVAHDSFTTAMTTGFTVAGSIAVAAALVTAVALPRRAARPHKHQQQHQLQLQRQHVSIGEARPLEPAAVR